MFSLQNKWAVVTGSSRGIGKGMAVALAKAGANIIGVSHSMPLGHSELSQEIESYGVQFHAYQCDFSNRSAVKQFADEINEKFAIDILVNNAGSIHREPAHEHAMDAWDRILEINLSAPFLLSQKIGQKMLERKKGKIIFTASLLSFQGGINVPSYAASKGALKQITHALANEWASSNIQVNAIAPGYIATDNTSALREDADRSEQILERIPAGRWGNPEDLGGATVFLASEASNYVNGIILPVDGGWLGR